MSKSIRALLMLVAAVATGALLWVAAQFDTSSTGGYWAALGLIALGGLFLGLAQFRRGEESPPWVRLVVFALAAFAGAWVIVAAQPDPNTYRDHVEAWSSDLGISGAVHSLGLWNGVLALGIGLLLGLSLEPRYARRRAEVASAEAVPAAAPVAVPAEPDSRIADEPVAADEASRVTDIGASPDSRRVTPTVRES